MAEAGLVYQEGDEPVPGYRLVKLLGGGGVGKAWRAVAPGGVDVAVKIVERLQEGGGRRELLGLEQIKNIPHSYVCKIYGFWAKNAHGHIVEPLLTPVTESSGGDTTWAIRPETEAVQLVIAMELGDETLADVYARHRRSTPPNRAIGLPVEQLLHYIETVGSAVDYLNCHHHICHCDIKPQNILMIGGEAKICDFGLARHVVDSKETGTPAFTPQYGAPEMMVGATYHPRMDQYSLALTYAELRMGRFPFPAYSQVHSHSQLAALAREKWEGKYDLSGLPDAERDVLAKALSPNPDHRFESIGQMLKALRAAVFPAQSWSPSENRPPTKASLDYREGDEPVPGYRLVKWLGGGGAGDTWRAAGPGGVEVAIKIVNRLQEGGGQRELLGLEQIKNIRHNHLCKIYGFWAKAADGRVVEPGAPSAIVAGPADTAFPSSLRTDAVQLVIAMELGDETLADLFARHQQDSTEGKQVGMSAKELFGYIEAAGRAVDYLNQRYSISHCDLKPQNILLVGGEAKVCDFGLARQVVDVRKTSTPAYTPQYGAPEMMVGAVYHPRMDQYSLALTYAELRAGRFPFPAYSRATSDSQLAALAREKWEGKYDLSDLPKAERKVIAKALRPDPDDRFENIADLLEALDHAIYTPPSSWPKRLVKLAMFGVLLVLLLLGGKIAWQRWGDGSDRPGDDGLAAVRTCLDRFVQDRNVALLDQAKEILEKIPSSNRSKELESRLSNGYLDCGAEALRRFSESGDLSSVDEALTWMSTVQSLDPGNSGVEDWYEQFARASLQFADQHLRKPDVRAAEAYLEDRIVQPLQAIPEPSRASLESRFALYRARARAAEEDWDRLEEHLGRVKLEDLRDSPEDQARFYLLQVQWAAEIERQSLADEEGLTNLAGLRSALDRLEPWERIEARRVEQLAHTLTDQARLDGGYASWSEKRRLLAEDLWPMDNGFRPVLVTCLGWVQSDLAEDWRKAREELPKLKSLATTPDDQWHVRVLDVLLDLKMPSDTESPEVVMSRFQDLLGTTMLPSSPLVLADLYEAFVGRLENGLRNGKPDLLGTKQARQLLSQDAKEIGTHSESLERRLQVLAVIAELGDDAANAAEIRALCKPLLEWVVGAGVTEDDRPWRSLVAAAWLETALLAPGSEEAFDDSGTQQIVNIVRSASPDGGIYSDYVRFVQSLLDGREEEKRLEAADRLLEEKIFESPSASPPLGTVRCRTLAVHLLAAAAHDLRTPGADGIVTEVFTSENAQRANKYLDLVRELREQPPKVVLGSESSEPLCDDFVFAYWAAGRDLQQVHDLADRRLASASTDPSTDPSAGPLLAVRARAARRLVENDGDHKSDAGIDRALRAHAVLLDWLFASTLTGESIEIRDQFLAEAVRIADLGDLQETLAKLPLELFVGQLRAPEEHVLERLRQFREPEAVARIFWWHGKQLRRGFDDSESELRRVLHVLAISKWLGPTAECMAELGEILLRLPYHKRFPGLDDAILALANDALQLDSDFHGAKGLRGHVNLVRSRGIPNFVERQEFVNEAIADYREAQKAVQGQPDFDPFRARYLVGLSAAYLDLAILAAADRKPFGCDDLETIQAAKVDCLKKALLYATEATQIKYRADAPEEAWIAKGHAEEDLAWHVRMEAYYEQAIASFTSAEEEASRRRRQSAEALFALGRCHLRQVVRQKLEDGADILKQDVINNLTRAAQGASEDHSSLPEIHHQLGDAYLCLYEVYEQRDDETKKRIMAAYESALQAASRVAPGRRFMYQVKRAQVAELLNDHVKAEQLAREFLEEAEKKEAPAEELCSILMLMLDLAKKEGGPQLQEVRSLVQKELDRFPEDDALLAWRRVWLLINLSSVTCVLTAPPDPLFDAALTDAQTAHELLVAKQNSTLFGPSERHFLLWKTQAALGEYYYGKWFLSKDLPGIGAQDQQQWRLQEIRYLSEAFQNFDQYKALCRTLSLTDLESANEHRLDLAFSIEEALKEFSTKLPPGQVKDLRKLGHDTTNALREAFPADSDSDMHVERLRNFFK